MLNNILIGKTKLLKNFSDKRLLIIGLIFTLVGSVYLLINQPSQASSTNPIKNFSPDPLKQYAQLIENECSNSKYHPACYDQEIPKLMDPPINLSMENAFKVTKLIQNDDSSFLYCHVIGHELSAKEYDKNPSAWEDIIPRCPFAVCANGCQHGVLQELARDEKFTDQQIQEYLPKLDQVCEAKSNWNPTPFEQSHCYHGLGHMTLYMVGGDIVKAANLCDQLGTKSDGRDFKSLCYQGLFMQLFQPLEPEDYALIKEVKDAPSKASLKQFCHQFDTIHKQEDCWNEGWPLYRDDIKTGAGIVEFCSQLDTSIEQNHCYSLMYYIIGQENNFDPTQIRRICLGMPKDRVAQCLGDSSSSIMQAESDMVEKSTQVCASLLDQNLINSCYTILENSTIYTYNKDSSQYQRLCQAMNDPFRQSCKNI